MYIVIIKEVIDKVVALVCLILLFPVLLCVAVGLAILQNGNVFFLQERPGKGEKIFKLLKFKTMTDQRDEDQQLLSDKNRLTSVGEFIRKTSLDELPQLFNVLKGEMSLVGPRPLLAQYLPLYDISQRKRHDVKPGITGWAQINGRNAISWKKKFELDIWYVEHQSFLLDLKIIFLTVKRVLIREGISQLGHATTEAFNGKN